MIHYREKWRSYCWNQRSLFSKSILVSYLSRVSCIVICLYGNCEKVCCYHVIKLYSPILVLFQQQNIKPSYLWVVLVLILNFQYEYLVAPPVLLSVKMGDIVRNFDKNYPFIGGGCQYGLHNILFDKNKKEK